MTLTCSPFTTAVQWTNSRLHLFIDWPVRARQCTRRQNKPCCYTLLTQQRMNTQIFSANYEKTDGKAKPAPALPPVRLLGWQVDLSDFLTGKSEWINSGRSHNTIRIASCWIFTLFGFIHVCGLHVIWIGAATCFYILSYYFFPVSTFPVSQKRLNVHNVTLDQKRSYLKLVQHFRKCPYLLYYQESDEKIDPSLISALQYAGG